MKHFYFLIAFFTINCYSQDEFITIWKTYSDGSIQLPIIVNDSTYTYSWQSVDNSFNATSDFSNEITIPANNGNITITFPESGLYRLKISTNSSLFRIHAENQQIYKIEQWGNIRWSSFKAAFKGAVNLDVTAIDSPNLENVTDLSEMFVSCTNLIYNPSINNWNTQNIIDFSEMFSNASNFNQPIGNWNTVNAITFRLMFIGANSFNQPINSWNVSNAIDFYGMFHYNSSFNKPLSNWVVSNGTNFEHMFCGTLEFNQDISKWNVAQGIKMKWMFNGAFKFNQNLGDWKLNSIVDGENFFNHSAMDCSNFTNTMLSWSNNPNLVEDIKFGIAEMKYNSTLNPTLDWFTNTKNWVFEGVYYEYENCTLNYTEFKKTNLNIYPNPTTNYFTIENIEVINVDIYDSKGLLVQKTLNNNIINIEHLSSGNYIIIINNKFTHNIIKK